jgi:agmatinase
MIKRHPWGDLAIPDLPPPHDLVVLGLPWDAGVAWRGGAAEAPARLREVSVSSQAITEEGVAIDPARLRVRDHGDLLPAPPGDDAERACRDYFARVEETAGRLLRRDPQPFLLTIGGDHSVSIPLLRAFGDRHPGGHGLILVDAHPDLFDTYEGSPLSHACPMRRALETGRVQPEHLLILGVRSYNQVEIDFMKQRGIRFVPAREIDRIGVEETVRLARQRLAGVETVYLTVDIDAADPACAPGTGFPVAGGLSSRQMIDLTRGLLQQIPVRAMDLVEVSPPLDPAGITLFLALQIVFEAFAVIAARGTAR